MIVRTYTCKHCGAEYLTQLSGTYAAIDTPKEYQSTDHCPDCQKVIVEALALIPVKFVNRFVKTDEVSLQLLLGWEMMNNDEKQKEYDSGKIMFPIGRRVFASSYNVERNESNCICGVIGRDLFKGRIYIYSYWPSNPEEYTILVEMRVDLITGKNVKYIINK